MTDAEKVQFLVDKLFGGKFQRKHDFSNDASNCAKCGIHIGWVESEPNSVCGGFCPITSIEDGFMVVEAMRECYFFSLETLHSMGKPSYRCEFTALKSHHHSMGHCEETPQQAIVEAAIAALKD